MTAKNKQFEIYTLDQIKDEFIGEIGTAKRTLYEQELKLATEEEKTYKIEVQSII